MKNMQEKYARVLLTECLKVEKGQPLFISFNVERIDFVRIVSKIAYEIGVVDIYYDIVDPYLKHEALKNLEVEDLKKLGFWDKKIWNVYAKKKAAFLMLASEMPGLMKDIDTNKISEVTKHMLKTRKDFDDLRAKSELAWCIAAVPTVSWAKEVFPNSDNPLEDLWNKIFEICSISKKNPQEVWRDKINKLSMRSRKLTAYRFKQLHYTSSNGTDLTVGLPDNHIWVSGLEKLSNGKEVLVNFPTEEVFTSPHINTINGIVYSSKPLSYQDVVIDKFWIKFKNGIAVDSKALVGDETLKSMINICKNSNKLGEVALVPYDSPISNSGLIFYETLYDENAACHLALGNSFPECYLNGPKMSKDELYDKGLNKCDSHVDFMIGTSDLNIIGTTYDGREIQIFKDGNFTEEFN